MWSRWKLSESRGIKTRWRVPETGCDNEAGRAGGVRDFVIYLERTGELRDRLRNDQRSTIKDKMTGLIGVGKKKENKKKERKVSKCYDFFGFGKNKQSHFMRSVMCSSICVEKKNLIEICRM